MNFKKKLYKTWMEKWKGLSLIVAACLHPNNVIARFYEFIKKQKLYVNDLEFGKGLFIYLFY